MSKSSEPESDQSPIEAWDRSTTGIEDYVIHARKKGDESNPPSSEDIARVLGLLHAKAAIRALLSVTAVRRRAGRHRKGNN